MVTDFFIVKLPLPKWSFKINASLLYKVNQATYVPLQANGDVHKGCIVVQFGSKEKHFKRFVQETHGKCEKQIQEGKPQQITKPALTYFS